MEALRTREPVTPEMVWAALKELAESQKETDRLIRETREQMKETRESQKETDRQIKETDQQIKETDRQMKLVTGQFGDLSNKFGELAEHLVAPGIVEKFNNLGYHFTGIADRGYKILEGKNLKTEIDILLENGKFIVAVEVKADVRKKDIDHHIKRLEILREHRDERKDKRKIRGAIAGAVFYPNIKEIALSKGLYVLEQSGDTMKMDLPKGFKPKEW